MVPGRVPAAIRRQRCRSGGGQGVGKGERADRGDRKHVQCHERGWEWGYIGNPG